MKVRGGAVLGKAASEGPPLLGRMHGALGEDTLRHPIPPLHALHAQPRMELAAPEARDELP